MVGTCWWEDSFGMNFADGLWDCSCYTHVTRQSVGYYQSAWSFAAYNSVPHKCSFYSPNPSHSCGP